MLKVTDCEICFERYNTTDKIPKILHCGHTFCKSCLIKSKYNSNNKLVCPICRKSEIFSDIDDLSTNRVIFDLLYNPTQEDELIIDEKYKYKIIVIGSASTGKTSLLNRCIKNKFDGDYKVTLGADLQYYKLKIGNDYIGLNIWDTAGTEKFQSIQKMYYKKSYAALIVFDVGQRGTFTSVEKWISFYRENKSKELKELIYLIGNKIDIGEERQVSTEEAEEFAKLNNLKYYETSAKAGTNVEKVFKNIGEEIFNTYKEGNIFSLNKNENDPKILDIKLHKSDNKSCIRQFFDYILNKIMFWK